MTEPGQNVSIYRGDTVVLNVTAYTDAAHTSPVKLKDCSIEYFLYKNALNPSLLTKTSASGGGIVFTNEDLGEFSITIPAGDLTDVYGNYYHLAKLTDASNHVSTLFVGAFTISIGKAD